jgi:hypothetical protein
VFFLAAIESPAQRFSIGLSGAHALGWFSAVSGRESADDRTARYTVGPFLEIRLRPKWAIGVDHCIAPTVSVTGEATSSRDSRVSVAAPGNLLFP